MDSLPPIHFFTSSLNLNSCEVFSMEEIYDGQLRWTDNCCRWNQVFVRLGNLLETIHKMGFKVASFVFARSRADSDQAIDLEIWIAAAGRAGLPPSLFARYGGRAR